MPSSNQGGQGSSAPVRSPGRNFLSTDPERQREAVAETARPREERHSAHAMQARPARNTMMVRNQPGPGRGLWDSDDEGGSGR